MNSTFKFKLLQALNKKNRNKGFTLIELLVVVIIIGVLAAIALPNLLNQVAKGRQADARSNLGVVNRAQQAYRLEKATFALLTDLPVQVTGQYYDFDDTAAHSTTALVNGSGQEANAKSDFTNDILDYNAAVGQESNGTFTAVICEQTTNPSDDDLGVPNIGTDAAAASCGTNGEQVK
ncbi:MAG: type IV pilin protein [Microcystis sp.]|uniref:type IV pilin protein n=1 Tax=Microcystis sp. TaxID=1127 RepID=UPI00391CA62C